MNVYMTNGTIDFLEKIVDTHPQLSLFIMVNEASPLIYYEDTRKSIFRAGRAYQLLMKLGPIKEKGFVTMKHIPVADDAKPVFEQRLVTVQPLLESQSGLQAYRFLKPFKGNTYIVLTQWTTVKNYETWKNSNDYSKIQQTLKTKQPAYFLERPFTLTYNMYEPMEDQEE